MILRPIDPTSPPEGLVSADDLRGVAIHWRSSPAPVSASPTRARKRKPPAPTWNVQRIAFHAVSARGEDAPPRDAAEQQRYVLAAYVIAACRHPIPSDAEIWYEVRW